MATFCPEDDFVVGYFFETDTEVVPMQIPNYLAERLSSTDIAIQQQAAQRLNQEFFDVTGVVAIKSPVLTIPSSADDTDTSTNELFEITISESDEQSNSEQLPMLAEKISEPPTKKPRQTLVPQRSDPFEIIFSESKADDEQPTMLTENKPPEYYSWAERDILLLLDLRKQMNDQFQTARSHTVLWGKLKKQLESNGVNVSVMQVTNKFKALKKEFKATVDHNKVSGNSTRSFKHLEYFMELYGKRAATVKPAHVVDTLEQQTPVQLPTTEPEHETPRKKITKKPVVDKMDTFMAETRDYRERQERFQKEQALERAKQHEDRLEVMKEFIKIIGRTPDKKE